MMTQTRKQTWLEIFLVTLTLGAAGVMLYVLYPLITAPADMVVPPPQEMGQAQLFLMIFVAMTAIGAPVTMGIVLALIFKFTSKRVAASSSVALEIPSPKARPRTGEAPKEVSPGEARVWKAAAAALLLLLAAGATVWLAQVFAQFYP
jgi:hypothetical protein